MIISKYFETRLSLANGIITCGASIGTLTLSPGLQWLFNRFGLSSAFRILGAVHLVVVVCGVIFRPVKDAAAPEKRKYFDWSICKNRSFIVYITALSFVMLGYLVPYVHLVSSSVMFSVSDHLTVPRPSSSSRRPFGRTSGLQYAGLKSSLATR